MQCCNGTFGRVSLNEGLQRIEYTDVYYGVDGVAGAGRHCIMALEEARVSMIRDARARRADCHVHRRSLACAVQ